VSQSVVDPAAGEQTLPPPLVRFASHPRQWIRIKIALLVAAVTLAHVGMFIVVALYYLLTQKNPTVKHFWDKTLVTNSDLRHSIRDVGEGVLGGFLAQAIVWNHFAKSHLKTGRIFDRLHDSLHIPEVPVALLVSAIFGAVGFLALYYGLHALDLHASAATAHGSLWTRTQTIWRSSWDKKAMGYGAAFVARRPMHLIFDDAQRWFAERRVALHKGTRWYQPPTFKARVNDIAKTVATTGHEVSHQGALPTALMLGSVLVGLALAGYGYYVLIYIA
jgi:hypothetical protein